jgi:hypothetical protein
MESGEEQGRVSLLLTMGMKGKGGFTWLGESSGGE